jgi:hypothetical protein
MQQKSANAILKISAILNFFSWQFLLVYLGLCTTKWLLQIEKKTYFTMARPAQRKVDFFPKMMPS